MVLRTSKRKITGGVRKAGRRVSPRDGHENAELVLITGLSGSGKGSALKAFEDLGYYCVDNLPVDLITKFADLCSAPGSRMERAAVVVDIRGGEALGELPAVYHSVRRHN